MISMGPFYKRPVTIAGFKLLLLSLLVTGQGNKIGNKTI